ncbi:regulator of condensation [Ancylostoma caninum]|uniref:Regulator of condensation n=1 Tax=Ancylostoma caninum TaxID=29170 RepID=A0A368GGQ3_ANCCA|nr:regulator of condensation [Ancylostoma caninum]
MECFMKRAVLAVAKQNLNSRLLFQRFLTKLLESQAWKFRLVLSDRVYNRLEHFSIQGRKHLFVLTGRLFSWGRNRFGQCGVGHCQPVLQPQLVEGNWGSVRELSAGQFHSAILNTKGQVWMFGWGVWGQLGLGGRHIKDCQSPTLVTQLNEPIKAVSCGRVHTVLLAESGKVLVAGSGSYGQMGTDEDVKKQYDFRPLPVPENLKFIKIATSFYHSIAITDGGRIFEWGRNPQEVKMRMFVVRRLRMAQLKRMADEEGEELPLPNMEKPKILLPMDAPRDDLGIREVLHLLDGPVVEAATGLSHSAVVTDQGSLFTWGKALDYQLGHGNKTERSEPHILFDPRDVKWELVACGGYFEQFLPMVSASRNHILKCGGRQMSYNLAVEFQYYGC